jgi:methanogenic corrinoid protein MtbC1
LNYHLEADPISIEEIYDVYFDKNKNRQYKEALNLIKENVNKFKAEDLLINVIAKTLNNLQKFEEKGYENISAFQVLAATKIAKDAIELILPFLKKETRLKADKKGKIILGNIFMDEHGLGREIIKVILIANNYSVIDLGLNVPISDFVDAAIKENAEWIFVSSMMYNTALGIKKISEELKKRNIKNIKIIVGGAPFNFDPKLYKKVKADFMAENASDILKILKKNKEA